MVTEETVSIENRRGLRLAGLAFRSSLHPALPLTIVCHGFTGSKEGRGRAIEMARWLAEHGYDTLLFDFAGCGESEGAFEDLTLSRNIEDIASVVAWAREAGWRTVALLGRSFGGSACVCYAAGDREAAGVCAWAAPVDLERLFDRGRRREVFLADGRRAVLPREFFSDLLGHDILECARLVQPRPFLVIHGTQDEVVPYREGVALAEAGGPAELLPLAGADHTLTGCQEAAWAGTLRWLQRCSKGSEGAGGGSRSSVPGGMSGNVGEQRLLHRAGKGPLKTTWKPGSRRE